MYERERKRETGPDSKLVRIKVKEEEREQDGNQIANEGQIVPQRDVYAKTGKGSECLNAKQLVWFFVNLFTSYKTSLFGNVNHNFSRNTEY